MPPANTAVGPVAAVAAASLDATAAAPGINAAAPATPATAATIPMLAALPPLVPEPAVDPLSSTTASFAAVEETTFSETDFEPEPMAELEPEPEPEMATAPPARFPIFAPEPSPSFTPPSMAAVRPRVEREPEASSVSFADLAPQIAERAPAPAPASEAAALSVPVEMVEKIAGWVD